MVSKAAVNPHGDRQKDVVSEAVKQKESARWADFSDSDVDLHVDEVVLDDRLAAVAWQIQEGLKAAHSRWHIAKKTGMPIQAYWRVLVDFRRTSRNFHEGVEYHEPADDGSQIKAHKGN